MSDDAPIEFVDLAAQRAAIGDGMQRAIERVVAHGQFILGPEVTELEAALAAFCGARGAICCGNGTDALQLALMVKGVGRGDAVLVPSFTFVATAEAVRLTGATPVFADVLPSTFNLDPAGLAAAEEAARQAGLHPRGLITVDLYGLPAEYDRINAFAAERGLFVIADAAQSFGARYHGAAVGTLAEITTTSFFPSKPLGCYGDGGAVLCGDADAEAALRSLHVHGRGTDKYDNVRVGMNSRLDTVQAAVLLQKLTVFPGELDARQRIAERYAAGLGNAVGVPAMPNGSRSAWAQYTITVADRDAVAARLRAAGVPTAVYYRKPLHRQAAYDDCPRPPAGLPTSDRLAAEALSLPMHPYLTASMQDRVIQAVHQAVADAA